MKKDKRWTLGVVLLLVAMLVTSCAPRRVKESLTGVPQVVRETVVVEKEVERVMKASEADKGAYAAGASWEAADVEQRMIIRTVEMTIVVEDTDEVLRTLRSLADSYDGYIASSRRWLANEQPHGRITVRVPAESLDQVIDRLHDMALRVEDENISGEDVTQEYVDLEARLRNLEATEEELLALLTEVRENRGKAEDILAIHRELTNIRGQIESLKGREQYLEQMSALATINVTVRPKAAPKPLVERAKWNPLVTLNRALRAFVNVFQVFVDVAIYVLIFSPFVVVPVVVLWLLVRWIRRRGRGNA
ncbi:MAG: DUF4349 domain-containing protein [Chloroflexota bacterium]|nr:DUF4349 domain-containing protein [Chloroflexota bacterium]